MKRDDALALVDFLSKGYNRPGSRTSRFHGHNAWTSFVVRESSDTLAQAHQWEVPGLFIADAEIIDSIRPYITYVYKMGCGAILVLVLPKFVVHGEVKVPNNLIALQKGVLYYSEPGFKVALQNWTTVGDFNDLVIKKGEQKARHVARKSPKAKKALAAKP